jgi:hypothetical protein
MQERAPSKISTELNRLVWSSYDPATICGPVDAPPACTVALSGRLSFVESC